MNSIAAKSFNPDTYVADNAFINTFPSELIEQIFSISSFATLRAGCLTCKKWEHLLKLNNNPRLWKRLVFQQDNKTRDPALRLKEMGFVGLSEKGKEVICTIIAERCSPLNEEIKKRSLQITNGVLISGPSGTGKTLLVRNLSSLLNCKIENIIILSGPEIYKNWKERAEVDIGTIFAKTKEVAQRSAKQNENFLLVIDDIDAIYSRCSNENNNSWMNSVVDEFLINLNALDVYNILVIGVTNNFKNLDEAVTRLKVFSEHIEIAIPDLQGRKELLHKCTLPLVEHKLLAKDIDFDLLAQESEGLSGADISAFVKQAMNHNMKRMMQNISAKTLLTMNDLCLALNEIKLIQK